MANAFQAIMDKAAQQPAADVKPKRDARPREQPRPTPASTLKATDGEPPALVDARPKSYRPVREGKRFVGAHFPPEVARQLKMLAAEDETTVQELLEQAIDLLFVKHGKAKAADLNKK